jgi:conjugative relaxase-like TrwC/TraI family protein
MISIGVVNSASGAATYYAKDNYYAGPEAESLGQWVGSGAEVLGLNGPVDAARFEAVLAGKLPGGAEINTPSGQEHRAGLDLVFSAPRACPC